MQRWNLGNFSARGVIGSRARLRIWWSDPWGFESLRADSSNKRRDFNAKSLFLLVGGEGKLRECEPVMRVRFCIKRGSCEVFFRTKTHTNPSRFHKTGLRSFRQYSFQLCTFQVPGNDLSLRVQQIVLRNKCNLVLLHNFSFPPIGCSQIGYLLP